MTYITQTVGDVSEIPTAIASFAAARGWTRVGNIITRPAGAGTPLSWEIAFFKKELGTGPRNHQIIVRDPASPAGRWVWTTMPELGGANYNNPAILTPTKLHLFGNDDPWDEETPGGTPHPWIACVVECGYNHYRHIFIGNMVIAGDYEGGEVIAMNHFTQEIFGETQADAFAFDGTNRYLFQANCQPSRGAGPGWNDNGSGGVRVVHGDNPVSWRKFKFPNARNGGLYNGLVADCVFGGMGDGPNDGLLKRGLSEFAGASILTPFNLFAPQAADGPDYRIRPLGWVPGVRAIDMRDVQSGASIEVGNKPYRVFAELQRNPKTQVFRGAYTTPPNVSGYWWEAETSGMLGLAYPE